MTGTVDLYGVLLDVPFDPPSGFARPGEPPSGPRFACSPASLAPIEEPTWQSGDALRVQVQRRPGGTAIDLNHDRFLVQPRQVQFDSNDPGRAFDVNHNVLLAMVLPYAGLVGLHANVVDVPAGRVAIVGESGAGKTTLGGELLTRRGRLVADDLLALDRAGRAHDGPPFRRLVEPRAGSTRDGGGKYRVPEPSPRRPPTPVSLFVVLDDCFGGPTRLSGSAALDALLARPYSPVAATRQEPLLRLAALVESVRHAEVLGLPPRWAEPSATADALISVMASGG